MKKSATRTRTVLIALLAGLAAAGCAPMLGTGEAPSLTVVVGEARASARTLLPNMTYSVDTYQITVRRSATDPNAASYTDLLSGSVAPGSFTFPTVPIGDWDVLVTGYDLSSQPVVYGELFGVTVADTFGANVTVDVFPLQTTAGTLELSYSFPPNEIEQVVVTVDDGVPTNIPATVDVAAGTATYTGTLASGFYELTAAFMAGGRTRAITVESLHIYDYQTTSHFLGLSLTDLGAPPAAPATFTATEISPGVVELTWDDMGVFETGFLIERSINNFATVEASFTAPANAEQLVMQNLSAGVFYYLRISALNDFGASLYAATNVTTAAAPVVIATNPTDGATGFPADSSLVIDFSTAMDQVATTAEVRVTAGSTVVPTTSTWPTTSRLEVVADGGYWPGGYRTFTLSIGENIRSSGGVTAGTATLVSFTTAGPVGELDPAFGVSGILTIAEVLNASVAYNDTAVDVAVGLDGSLYVAGTSYEEYMLNHGTYVYALDPVDGTGAYGNPLIYVDVSATVGEDMWAKALTVDRYGDLVVGIDFVPATPGFNQVTFLSRGATGIARAIFAGGTTGMEIVGSATPALTNSVAFSSTNNALFATTSIDNGGSLDATVMKYAYSGADAADPDSTFGTGGTVAFNKSADDWLLDITVDEASGLVYAVGHTLGLGSDMWLVCLDPATGGLNTGFAGSGEVIIDYLGMNFHDSGHAVAVDPSGRIVVAGQVDAGSGERMAVWRFLSDGTLDTTFAGSGTYVDADLSVNAGSSRGLSLDFDAAGNIVVGGYVDADTSKRSAVWRLTDAGVPDTTFNPAATGTTYAGGVIYDVGGTNEIKDLVVHPNQGIYGVGDIEGATSDGFVIKLR